VSKGGIIMFLQAKKIPGFESYYIDVEGTVYSTMKNKIVKISTIVHSSGYLVVGIDNSSHKVHRLLAKTYLGLTDESDLVVNHKDFNKTNNSLDNLELVTYKQNAVHARLGGRFKKKFGEDNPMSKHTEEKILLLRRMCELGLHDKEVGSILNMHPRDVGRIRLRRRWSHI
jgi:hypothetical protein